MCESSVYLLRGDERTLIMREAARLQVSGDGIVCVDSSGGVVEVADVEIVDANLIRHEVVLRPKGA